MDLEQNISRMTRRQFVTATGALFVLDSFGPRVRVTRGQLSGKLERGPGLSRVIIDTDPGVDDALALLLAMRSPELKIEAITAVAGNVPLELTLPNALRMVEIAGRSEIPVAEGAKAPLVRRSLTAAYDNTQNGLRGCVEPVQSATYHRDA